MTPCFAAFGCAKSPWPYGQRLTATKGRLPYFFGCKPNANSQLLIANSFLLRQLSTASPSDAGFVKRLHQLAQFLIEHLAEFRL